MRLEALFATERHTRDVHCFAVEYAVLKMVRCTVHAELVATG